MTLSQSHAQALDAADPLASYRDRFIITDPTLVYVDGNSLGRLTHTSQERVQAVLNEEWGDWLIRGWNRGWYEAPQRLGDKIGALIGAAEGQVIAGDSTSVNLFKLATAALRARPGRTKIVSDRLNFPSDLYILQGCVDLLGNQHTLHLIGNPDDVTVPLETILDAIDETTALVSLSHVTFKSGFMYDMAAITAHAHAKGALVLWDLSHAVGAVEVELDDCKADLAVGCTYKYLNGGPGAPAFLYVNKNLQEELRSPIWGWFGQDNPFAFDLHYSPAPGIARFQVGTPPTLSLLAIEPAVEMLNEVGMAAVRRKSVLLGDYLISLYDEFLAPLGFTLGSPRDATVRGSHVSFRHPEGYRINRALIDEMGVLPDFRAPDNLRLGLTPLYTTFGELWEMTQRIVQVMEKEIYLKYSDERTAVT
jgi:kynureninase